MFGVFNVFKDLSNDYKKKTKRLVTTGVIVSGVGAFLSLTFPILLWIGLKSQMQIKLGNDLTANWLDVPLPITVKIHVWSIENPNQFLNGDKPKLREVGPYYWIQHKWKEIISWGQNEESVKYWSLQSFTFDKSRTALNLSDKITAIAYVVKSLTDGLPMSFAISPIIFGFVNMLFITHGEGLIKELTVGELIEGYPFTILNTIDIITKPLTWFGLKLPDNGMPGNRFGVLSVKNFTKVGPYEVYTGQGGNSHQFLKYISFQGKDSLDFYEEMSCNLMNGSDGTTMGSFISKYDTIYLFQGDACRSFLIKFKEESSVRGIHTFRFIFPDTMFSSPNKNPDNKCFCRTLDNYEKCDGIFDLGPCQKGAPLAFSFPHLMHCSKAIQNTVIGVEPNIEKHESFFDIEPTLGAPLRASGKLQINVLLKPIPLVPGFAKVNEAVVPYVWIDEFVEIDDKFESMIKMTTITMTAIRYGSLIIIFIGVLVMTTGFGYGFTKLYKSKTMLQGSSTPSPVKDNPLSSDQTKSSETLSPTKPAINGLSDTIEDNNGNQRLTDAMLQGAKSNHMLSAYQIKATTQTPALSESTDSNVYTITQQRSNVGHKTKDETKLKIMNQNSIENTLQSRSTPPGNVE